METTDRTSEITRRVILLAAEQTGVNPSTVTPETHFVNDLNWDSLDVMDFVIKLEEEFELSVRDEDVAELPTVDKVIEYVLAETSQREPKVTS